MATREIVQALGLAVALGSSTTAWAGNTVTFWVRSDATFDPANTKIVTVDKLPANVTLGKSCAGRAGKFQTWQAIGVDPRGDRDGVFMEIVASGLPASAEILSSIRSEGTCTEAGVTWAKYTGVPEKAFTKPAAAKPKPTATPKPAKKKPK